MNNITKELEKLRIKKEIIQAIEESKLFSLELDEENIFRFKLSADLAYEFYCEDYTSGGTINSVTFLDILYSQENKNSFADCHKHAALFEERFRRGKFNIDDTAHALQLICHLAVKINGLKYSELSNIDKIDKEIPLSVFMSILNKQENKPKVSINIDGYLFAGVLSELFVQKSMMGTKLYGSIEILSKNAEKYVLGAKTVQLPALSFVKSLSDLGLEIIDDSLLEILTERGKKYLAITKKPYYCKYSGYAFTEGWMADIRHSVNSRVMIDIAAMNYLNSNIDDAWYEGNVLTHRNNVIGETIPEDKLWMTSPAVYGFVFGNKIWCKMNIDNISEIEFSQNAFNELIIPEGNKNLFIASLTHDMPSLDSIESKGQGKIFLLYGAPGVGKTMTAESVAEFLQKPLYFVSVGELGVNPSSLEESLDDIMKVATSWDAIILLDEVDVFAVNREGASIERNAMTAIFLRMLERYSGIMFMTTNLLENLDPAFISRATAVIKYEDLKFKDREMIWHKILEKAKSLNEITIDNKVYDNIPYLATEKLNGRVIKNIVRLSYALALASEDKVLRLDYINSALKLR